VANLWGKDIQGYITIILLATNAAAINTVMAKPPKTGYEVHAFTTHPLYESNDAFSRHFLEVYRDVGRKTLLCPDCSACASFKSWAHLKSHYMTCKGPTIVAAGLFNKFSSCSQVEFLI